MLEPGQPQKSLQKYWNGETHGDNCENSYQNTRRFCNRDMIVTVKLLSWSLTSPVPRKNWGQATSVKSVPALIQHLTLSPTNLLHKPPRVHRGVHIPRVLGGGWGHVGFRSESLIVLESFFSTTLWVLEYYFWESFDDRTFNLLKNGKSVWVINHTAFSDVYGLFEECESPVIPLQDIHQPLLITNLIQYIQGCCGNV